jgi:hypothetical protein
MIKKCYFAKCGAKVLLFLHPAKYFLYFCLEISIYLDELEESNTQVAHLGSCLCGSIVPRCRLAGRMDQPQLVSILLSGARGAWRGVTRMADEKREPLLTDYHTTGMLPLSCKDL